jgi:DNA polymerase V
VWMATVYNQVGILDGDLLIVDRAARPVSGSIVVVALKGEYTVKRLRISGGAMWLDPANPKYSPMAIDSSEELHVFGVIRHAIHTLK